MVRSTKNPTVHGVQGSSTSGQAEKRYLVTDLRLYESSCLLEEDSTGWANRYHLGQELSASVASYQERSDWMSSQSSSCQKGCALYEAVHRLCSPSGQECLMPSEGLIIPGPAMFS